MTFALFSVRAETLSQASVRASAQTFLLAQKAFLVKCTQPWGRPWTHARSDQYGIFPLFNHVQFASPHQSSTRTILKQNRGLWNEWVTSMRMRWIPLTSCKTPHAVNISHCGQICVCCFPVCVCVLRKHSSLDWTPSSSLIFSIDFLLLPFSWLPLPGAEMSQSDKNGV